MLIKISVVVPVYNTEKYLKKCLESILNQSLKEIEVIIVNDGSPDRSYEIINQFSEKDDRIKVINKKNGGLSSARNAGINIAQGEYILNIDSDDWVEKNYFEDMYLRAKKNDLDIVISDALWDWENSRIEYRKDLDISDKKNINGSEYIDYFLQGKVAPSVWNKLFKTSLYKNNCVKHPENISLGEDLATTPKLAYFSKKIGKINKAYIHYIQNPESITKNQMIKKIDQLLEAFDILEKFFQEKNENFDLKELKLKHLIQQVYSDYDINDKIHKKMIETYLDLNKKIDLLKFKNTGVSKKNYLYSWIFKKIPNKNTFRVLYFINKTGIKIKEIISKK